MLKTDFKFAEVKNLSEQIESEASKVTFKEIFGTDSGGVSLLAFKAGQGLQEHVAPAELMVYIIDGEIEFNVSGKGNLMLPGDFLLIGQGVAHSVAAMTDAKVKLVKVKP